MEDPPAAVFVAEGEEVFGMFFGEAAEVGAAGLAEGEEAIGAAGIGGAEGVFDFGGGGFDGDAAVEAGGVGGGEEVVELGFGGEAVEGFGKLGVVVGGDVVAEGIGDMAGDGPFMEEPVEVGGDFGENEVKECGAVVRGFHGARPGEGGGAEEDDLVGDVLVQRGEDHHGFRAIVEGDGDTPPAGEVDGVAAFGVEAAEVGGDGVLLDGGAEFQPAIDAGGAMFIFEHEVLGAVEIGIEGGSSGKVALCLCAASAEEVGDDGLDEALAAAWRPAEGECLLLLELPGAEGFDAALDPAVEGIHLDAAGALVFAEVEESVEDGAEVFPISR